MTEQNQEGIGRVSGAPKGAAMNWQIDKLHREARTLEGYVIAWCAGPHGSWFNAYSPQGKHLEASYDRAKVKAACAAHHAQAQSAIDFTTGEHR